LNKRDLVIVALATFCLTSTLFMILPSRSAEPYNPWGDVSGPTIGEPDGTINMRDINYEILRFNTFGDTAKNVTIAAHASKLAYNITTSVPAGQQFTTPWILVDGYSKISVCVYNVAAIDSYSLTTRHTGYISEWYVDHQVNATGDIVKTYDVPNQEIRIICENNDAGSRTLSLDIYLLA
jgi:hypothetical protein